jgi:hypothetical protein
LCKEKQQQTFAHCSPTKEVATLELSLLHCNACCNNLLLYLLPVFVLTPTASAAAAVAAAVAAAAAAAACHTFPHIANMSIAIVFSVVFIAVGGLFALADVTPNPASQNWLATAHATVEFKTWVFKTLIVIFANVLTGFLKLQITPIMIFAAWIAYVHIRWVSLSGSTLQWCKQLRLEASACKWLCATFRVD